MKISKTFFWVISFLILVLPLSMQWRLIFFGEKTIGTVVEHREEKVLEMKTIYSIIRFEVDDTYYDVVGPADAKYSIGKTFTIYYKPSNPNKLLVWNFAGIFFQPARVLPIILFVVWLAFYFSFKPKA